LGERDLVLSRPRDRLRLLDGLRLTGERDFFLSAERSRSRRGLRDLERSRSRRGLRLLERRPRDLERDLLTGLRDRLLSRLRERSRRPRLRLRDLERELGVAACQRRVSEGGSGRTQPEREHLSWRVRAHAARTRAFELAGQGARSQTASI